LLNVGERRNVDRVSFSKKKGKGKREGGPRPGLRQQNPQVPRGGGGVKGEMGGGGSGRGGPAWKWTFAPGKSSWKAGKGEIKGAGKRGLRKPSGPQGVGAGRRGEKGDVWRGVFGQKEGAKEEKKKKKSVPWWGTKREKGSRRGGGTGASLGLEGGKTGNKDKKKQLSHKKTASLPGGGGTGGLNLGGRAEEGGKKKQRTRLSAGRGSRGKGGGKGGEGKTFLEEVGGGKPEKKVGLLEGREGRASSGKQEGGGGR